MTSPTLNRRKAQLLLQKPLSCTDRELEWIRDQRKTIYIVSLWTFHGGMKRCCGPEFGTSLGQDN